MPIPKPRKDEKQDDYMQRCMSHDMMKEDFPEQKQRVAVCMRTWREKDKEASGQWWTVRASSDPGTPPEVWVYGDIGETLFDNEESITAKRLIEEIKPYAGRPLTVRVNSFGGSVSDGIAIHNALRRHGAPISVEIDGFAVSIASLIAMAGDTIRMSANGLMMIHAPYGAVMGNANDLRQGAVMLDKFAAAMATSYAAKTGKPMDEILTLVSDGQDHWYTADQAVEAGLADEIVSSMPVAAHFDISRFNPPDSIKAAISRISIPMSRKDPNEATAQVQAAADPVSAPISAPDPTPVSAVASPDIPSIEAAARQKAFAALSERNRELRTVVGKLLRFDHIRAEFDAIIGDPEVSLDKARERILAKLAEDSSPVNAPQSGKLSVGIVVDERQKFVKGASDALLVKAGVDRKLDLSGNEYRNSRLFDLAKDSLVLAGVNPRGMDPRQVVAIAFTQGTSDFPNLLETTLHRALLGAYTQAPDTWRQFCKVISVSDFRAWKTLMGGTLGSLDDVNELAEFKNKPIPDLEGEEIKVTTRGNIVNISRQAVIDDDLNYFTDLATMLGRAARRTIETKVYDLFALNSGGGPTMRDTNPLFHSTHGNLSSSSDAITVASLDAARSAMAVHKDSQGNDYLDIRPAVLLVPIGKEGNARVVVNAQYDPDTASKLQRPNMVQGIVGTIIGTPRLSGNSWYLLADPNDAPVFEVAFLNGQQEPYLEQQQGFDVDGLRWKVRLDFGVGVVDWRGAYKNPGA